MPIFTDLERVNSAMVRTLNEWWMRARKANGLPTRGDFDPIAFKPLLPHLIIADVERDPFRVHYRLAGTRVVAFTGFEFTGRYVDELAPAEAAALLQDCYRTVYDSRRPLFGSVTEPTTA